MRDVVGDYDRDRSRLVGDLVRVRGEWIWTRWLLARAILKLGVEYHSGDERLSLDDLPWWDS